MSKEIYWNETRNVLLTEVIETAKNMRLDEWPGEDIQRYDSEIASQRPKVYKALCEGFGYGPQFAFNRVYQFSACNFSTHDGRADIGVDWLFTVERVPCPVRHKCSAGYCSNENMLSVRETEIVRLFAQGCDEDSIAVKLFIARSTVHNHMTNIYHKLGLSGNTHPERLLLSYAYSNKII